MTEKILSKETLLVAALTLGGYLVGLLFESGYSEYYEFPTNLISVDIKSIVYGCIAVSGLVILIYLACSFTYSILKLSGAVGSIILFAMLYGCLILFFLLTSYLKTGELGIKLYVSLGALFTLALLVTPFRYRKKGISFKQGVDESISNLLPQRTPKSKYMGIEEIVVVYAFLLFLAYAFITSSGVFWARSTSLFYTFTKGGEDYAIIKIYGENVITRKIKEKKITKGTIIFKDSELTGLELKKEKAINNH